MNPDSNSGSNPYDFIMNPAAPSKKAGFGGDPFIKRIIFIVGGAVLLMVVLAVAVNLLSGKKTDYTSLISLAQTQTELNRVAVEGSASAVQQPTKNLAATVQLTIQTQEQQLLAYLSQHGQKVGKKQLGLKQNAQTDQQLTAAQQNSTYDIVFSQLMQTQLQSYATTLRQLFNAATGPTLQTLLSNDYTQTQLLLAQVPSSQDLQGS